MRRGDSKVLRKQRHHYLLPLGLENSMAENQNASPGPADSQTDVIKVDTVPLIAIMIAGRIHIFCGKSSCR